MTKKTLAPLFGLLGAGVLLATASAGCNRTESLDVSKMPENVRADYEVFAHKCSKCHSLARPLSAKITDDEQWVLYVNRMRRQPGSGINLEDQTVILRFLRYYAADLRRIEAEKKGGDAGATTKGSDADKADKADTTDRRNVEGGAP